MSINKEEVKLNIDNYISNYYRLTDVEKNKLNEFVMQEFVAFLDKSGVNECVNAEGFGSDNKHDCVNYAFKKFIDSQVELLHGMWNIYKGYMNRGIKK